MVATPTVQTTGPRSPRYWPEGMPRELTLPEATLFDNLHRVAQSQPAKPLVIFDDKALRYGQALAHVEALAAWLQQRCGVQRGDRVLLFSQNCPAYVVAYYAVLRADAVVVPVNAMCTADELGYQAQDASARVALVGRELADRALACAEIDHVLVHDADSLHAQAPTGMAGTIGWHEVMAAALRPAPHAAMADDLCVLPYTSGTTGRPKGCRHTHRSIQAAVYGSRRWRQLGADLVTLAVAPLFHLLGMQNGMNLPILCGGTLVMLARWDAAAAAQLIQRHRVTHWAAAPAMVVDFFAQPGLDAIDLSSLKLLVSGGAAVPDAVSRRLLDRYGLVLNESYGMTETAAFLHCNPVGREKPCCLGVPTFGVDSRVIDPETLHELAANEVGELVTSGRQIMQGYWQRPEADREVFIELDGKRFLRTGDLCHVDDEGYFFMRDRLKRMISVSGYKVWPAEVENQLYAHPAVHEACVIGTPDARSGEAVKALLVLKPGAQLQTDEFIAWAREHMAVYKAPRFVDVVDRLPKSGTGKILWRELQNEENSRGVRS